MSTRDELAEVVSLGMGWPMEAGSPVVTTRHQKIADAILDSQWLRGHDALVLARAADVLNDPEHHAETLVQAIQWLYGRADSIERGDDK